MDFELNEEQRMLRDSVRRFVDKAYAFDARAARLRNGSPFEPAHWAQFAESGWLAAALPEPAGGLGGGVVENLLIAMEMGRGLVVEPFVASAVLAAQTFVAAASPGQTGREGPRLADGSRRFALACGEPQGGVRGAARGISAQPRGGGWRLDGISALVPGGCDAHAYVVWAALPAGADGHPRHALFLVEAGAAGVTRTALPLHDGCWAAQVRFEAVALPADTLLCEGSSADTALCLGRAHGIAGLCAELVGGMERAIELTADYLKVRRQFGVPIASFQALQHRMADMAAELELARSITYVLLAAIRGGDGQCIQEATSQAKALVGRAARHVCAQAIQLHGGIGMTEELAIGHYFKRAVVADILLGNADLHEAHLATRLQAAMRPQPETA